MNLVYNSDAFAVVQITLGPGDEQAGADAESARGGYEIVDKFAKKGIFIDGALARRFREGVEALAEQGPSEEDLDEFIAGYTELAQQPLTLH